MFVDPAVHNAPTGKSVQSSPMSTRRHLVCDDAAMNRSILVRILKLIYQEHAEPIEIEEASDGKMAVEACLRRPFRVICTAPLSPHM